LTITNRHETGDPEGLQKTIGAFIERNWQDSLDPDDIKPDFHYDDKITENWPTKMAKLAIYFNLAGTIKVADRSDSSKVTVGYMTNISIDGFAPNMQIAERCLSNITAIIQDNYPNNSNRINKSDTTSVSKITTFDNEPDFTLIPKNASGQPNHAQFSAILGCLWNTIKA